MCSSDLEGKCGDCRKVKGNKGNRGQETQIYFLLGKHHHNYQRAGLNRCQNSGATAEVRPIDQHSDKGNHREDVRKGKPGEPAGNDVDARHLDPRMTPVDQQEKDDGNLQENGRMRHQAGGARAVTDDPDHPGDAGEKTYDSAKQFKHVAPRLKRRLRRP